MSTEVSPADNSRAHHLGTTGQLAEGVDVVACAREGRPLPWLQEPDPDNPAIRYFALRDLLDRPAEDPEAQAAHAAIMTGNPIPVILRAQHLDGYWQWPGGGY